MKNLEYLRKHCATDNQESILDAVIEHGSNRKAAKHLGKGVSTVAGSMARLRTRAAMAGEGEHFQGDGFPAPLSLKGTSTLYGDDGLVKSQWVKTVVNGEQKQKAIEDWINWLIGDAKGLSPKVKGPKGGIEDLLTVYPMGDPHFGMRAWAQEVGESFDLEEAERRTQAAIDYLVSATPNTKEALLVNLGDMFHADNSSNRTPASGNELDVDGRHWKVAQVGLRAMVYCIIALLEKHEKVIVYNIPGNHDPDSSRTLAIALDAWFRNNDRVEIVPNPAWFFYYKFGKVLIGMHHGHGPKLTDLPLIMAADRPKEWGETEHRHWLVGHFHHKQLKEHPGVNVETFNTLAGSDGWHNLKGYRAKQNMQAIVYHKEHGEDARHICSLQRIYS